MPVAVGIFFYGSFLLSMTMSMCTFHMFVFGLRVLLVLLDLAFSLGLGQANIMT